MQEKASLLGRVNEIIQTLKSSTDHTQGGELAGNLDLYDYMIRRILEASGQNSTDMIDDYGLMLEVKTGWDGIRQEYLESVHGTRLKRIGTGAPVEFSICLNSHDFFTCVSLALFWGLFIV